MDSLNVATQLNLKPNKDNFFKRNVKYPFPVPCKFYHFQDKAKNLICSDKVDIFNYWSIEILELLGNKEPSEEQITAMEYILKLNDLDIILKTLQSMKLSSMKNN